MERIRTAIIGSGNIGCDLMIKLLRNPAFSLQMVAGIDPASEGLALAKSKGIAISARGIEDVLKLTDVQVVFDATSAAVHRQNAPLLREAGIMAIDLTPAMAGELVVPSVNLDKVRHADNLNMVTCAGQATVPMVYAASRVGSVAYAETVSSISSRSAGIGTRSNIDEFTQTTAKAIRSIGTAQKGKAIIILNPAIPPINMTNTIFLRTSTTSERAIKESCEDMLHCVQAYVPGYRFRVPPIVENDMVTLVIEVKGAGDYLPAYAGNLDIITSAAVVTAEKLFC